MAPLAAAAGRLETIPGVSRRAAEVIVAEIGTDMTKFPTAGHLARGRGCARATTRVPASGAAAGRPRGASWLRATLTQAAWAASHTKETLLSATYRRWARRLGKKRAIVALGRKILVIAYELLKGGTDYVERLAPGQAA